MRHRGTDTVKHDGVQMKVRDPVCGMEFYADQAPATTEYDGQTFHFCAEQCKLAFLKDPMRFVRTT